MANLSITQAWNETVEFVRREAGLLFPVSFMLVSLPNALREALTPPPPLPGQLPPAGLWVLLIPVALVAAIIGNIAISYLALRPGSSVGEALRRGVARMPALLAAALLVGIVGAILFFILAIISFIVIPGALPSAPGSVPTQATINALVLAFALMLPILLFFGARLMMTTPAAAAESGGPFALIGRSWMLTADHVWKLIGFLLLLLIALIVIFGAIAAVAGILFTLVAGPIVPGSTSAWLVIVLMALVNMVVTTYLTSLVARIYAQIAGTITPQVFA
jgi:hypothetical protein